MMRAVYGEHQFCRSKPRQSRFSADAIPGNELNYFGAIDILCRNRVKVLSSWNYARIT